MQLCSSFGVSEHLEDSLASLCSWAMLVYVTCKACSGCMVSPWASTSHSLSGNTSFCSPTSLIRAKGWWVQPINCSEVLGRNRIEKLAAVIRKCSILEEKIIQFYICLILSSLSYTLVLLSSFAACLSQPSSLQVFIMLCNCLTFRFNWLQVYCPQSLLMNTWFPGPGSALQWWYW